MEREEDDAGLRGQRIYIQSIHRKYVRRIYVSCQKDINVESYIY